MPKPSKPVLRKSDYEVKTVPLVICREMVARLHYSHGSSNTAVFRHGLFLKGSDKCLGVACWLPPIKAAALANYPQNWQAVLSLSRLVIEPEVPQNAASFLIMQSVRLIRKDPRWEYLLTYADEWQKHEGIIYKATNWNYLGKTAKEATWVDADGMLVCRKATRTRRRDEMISLGHVMIGRFARHRFGMKLVGGHCAN